MVKMTKVPHRRVLFCFNSTAIDTMKTVLQVDSAEGFRSLIRRVKAGRISVLYEGSAALAVSAMIGHYPWVSFSGNE
jgi:hypothetical protein